MAIYLHINHHFGTISVRDQTKPYKGNYTILYASSVFLPFKFLKRQINSKNTSKTIKLCPLYFDLLPLIKCLCDSHDVLILTVLSYVSILFGFVKCLCDSHDILILTGLGYVALDTLVYL